MKKSPKLAFRYANALYEFAEIEKKTEEVYQDILLLKQIFQENSELRVVIESPIIVPDKKSAIFSQLFEKNLSPITFGFLLLILKKRREPSLMMTLDSFITLYYQAHNIKTATLTTATQLNEILLQGIKETLEKQTQSTIDLQVKEDPAILGGFIIKLEDQLLDASLLGKINKLKSEFSKNVYQTGF